MKFIYSFIFSLVGALPLLALGQALPQIQVSSLETSGLTYNVGTSIAGSATINNISTEDASDIYYQISYGEYGEKGGNLISKYTSNALEGPLYIEAGKKTTVNFTITPELVVQNAGIDVVITHKNGALLGWKKIPVQITGGSSAQAKGITAVLSIDGEEYPLMSGPTVSTETDAQLLIAGTSETLSGEYNAHIVLHARSFNDEKVYDQVTPVTFTDGVASFSLPADLKAESYVGTVAFESNGKVISNVVNFRYVVGGAQAEIIEISTDKLSVNKGEDLSVQVTYSGTPLNINNSQDVGEILTLENIAKLSLRLVVTNEEGEEVARHEGPLKTSNAQYPELTEGMSDEEAERLVAAYLDTAVDNTLVETIALKANESAKHLAFDIELYNPETSEIYDTYSTSFPEETGYTLVDYIKWILIVIVTILFVLIIRLLIKGKRTPVVSAALILAVGLLASLTIIHQNDVEASIVLEVGGTNNGVLAINSPISSGVGGYDPGSSIDLDMSYTVYSCANNGNINLNVVKPKENTWHTFTSASAAQTHIKNNLPTNSAKWQLTTIPGCTPYPPRQTCTYYTWVKTPITSAYYERVERQTTTWRDSGAYFGNTFIDVEGGLTAPSQPGKYFIPFMTQYCTTSHGCASKKYSVYEICINGAGLCPGEEDPDACNNVAGIQTLTGGVVYNADNQATNYVQNPDGSCTAGVCPPGVVPPPNLGAACGCPGGLTGTIQCDGSCRTAGGQSIPTSCTSCNDEHAEGETCTTNTSCGPTSGTYSCQPTGWVCNAPSSAGTCDDDTDVCPNIDGNQLSVPVGKVKNASGQCVDATTTDCSLATVGQSYCVQLFDKTGAPTYTDSGLTQADYNAYFKNKVETSTYYVGGVLVTDHAIYGTVGNPSGTCQTQLCTPANASSKTGCVNEQPARCYSESDTDPYNVQLDIKTSPDFVAAGQICNIVWTSQDTDFCNLTQSGSASVLSYSTAGTYGILMGDESITVTLGCQSIDPSDSTIYTKQAICRTPADFSEI